MKYLILLDRKFPYETGEAFLESEIAETAKYFDKILIYPDNIAKWEKQTREITAKNVETHIVEKNNFKKRKIAYLFSSIGYIRQTCKIKGFKNKLAEAYFLAAANSQAKKIYNDIKQSNIKKSDKIYLYSYWLYITAEVACILKSKLQSEGYQNIIAFSRAHRFDIYEEKCKNNFLPHRQELLKNLDAIYPCSNNGTQYLINKYPEFKKKIKTSYLGTYNHGLRKYRKHSSFNIVSCSRVAKVKRVNLIIDALEGMKDSGLNLTWTHIGGGKLLEKTKQEASEKLNWMKVDFLGQKNNTEVYDYYLNHDVDLFINVSSSEGLPVSIMEAISFGIPAIATNVGGTSEIVEDGANGYLLPSNFEVKKLSQLIEKITTMDNLEYQKIRHASRKKWQTQYQAQKNYSAFCTTLKESH